MVAKYNMQVLFVGACVKIACDTFQMSALYKGILFAMWRNIQVVVISGGKVVKKTKQLTFLAGAGSVALLALAGCGGQDNSANNTASTDTSSTSASTSGNVANAAGNEANAAGNVATAAGNEAKGAGGAVSNAASGVGGAINNSATAATTTEPIRTALGANAALKGLKIGVTTTAKDVTLTGAVKNATQKKVAETIAKSKAGGLNVIDKLTVSGGASPMMSTKKP